MVSMGMHSVEALGTEASPAVSVGKLSATAKNIDLKVKCTEGSKISVELKPFNVMGKGVGVTGSAEGVQIMLVSGGNVLDFSQGDTVTLGALTGRNVSIPLKAYYTLQAGKVASDAKAGTASALVAYTLTYE